MSALHRFPSWPASTYCGHPAKRISENGSKSSDDGAKSLGQFIDLEVGMPRKRTLESEQERDERLKTEALRVLNDVRAAEDAVDKMVKQSIRRYGP
jgi:hypothetical protein